MKVAIAADHAGYPLKEELLKELLALQHEPVDLGTNDPRVPSDYPDSAEAVGNALTSGRVDRGILVCGSGVGVCAAANKFPGVRAAVCHDTYSARQGVEHDDMNVLCLGGRIVGSELAREIVHAFLKARFSEEPRHRRRLEKLKAIETRFLK